MLQELINYLRPGRCNLSLERRAKAVISAAQKARAHAQKTVEKARATLDGEDAWFVECIEKPIAEKTTIN